jgi:hypothetical protein
MTTNAPPIANARRSPAERRRLLRGLVALGRDRLRRAPGARGAVVLAAIIGVVFAAVVVMVRVSDGGDAPLGHVVGRAARWLLWLVGAPIAFSAARDRLAHDRAEGLDALAAARGFSARALDSGRLLGAMLHAIVVLGVPLVSLGVLTVALAGSAHVAVARLALVAGAFAYALIAGATIGLLGAGCGRLGGRRGRLLLGAVVLLPWMIAAEVGHASWSIPGALEAVRSFTLNGVGGA